MSLKNKLIFGITKYIVRERVMYYVYVVSSEQLCKIVDRKESHKDFSKF